MYQTVKNGIHIIGFQEWPFDLMKIKSSNIFHSSIEILYASVLCLYFLE